MNIETEKLIRVKAGEDSTRIAISQPIYKEDYGLYLFIEGLELPAVYTVDFSNSETVGSAVSMIGNTNGVLIPQQFIKSGKTIFAYLYLTGNEVGKTVYKFKIPNRIRPDRTNEEPTPTQQSVIDQAISALNSAVEQTAQDVIDADASAQSASDDADRAEQARDTADGFANSAEDSAENARLNASQASASATASANSASQSAQIKTDVEGMVDDAQASASASAQSASASANSASQASASATSASQSASSAQGYASQAQTSAQTASTKASEASGYASTASAKATESAQSATNAQGYAQTAEQAKTASQTAQGLAESARDSAISAKTDAESAKADAESARDEAQTIVDGISGALDDKAPVITDTASGSIASFPDGADNLPLKSLVVDINPIQDLHGQDAPYPAGGGKNKVNFSNLSIEANVDKQLDIGTVALPAGTYTLSYTLSATVTATRNRPLYLLNGIAYYGNDIKTVGRGSWTFTLEEQSTLVFKWWGHTVSAACTISDFMLESGSTATAYAPYENICPISGWTGMQIQHTGKNHCNAEQTIPISWQTEAGTVYSGRLDVLSGVMTVDRAMVDLGTLNWTRINTQSPHWRFWAIVTGMLKDSTLMSNQYAQITPSAQWTGAIGIATQLISGTPAVMVTDERYETAADFKTAMSGVQLVYELATPIEYQLEPHEVASLLGTNNIFADTGDCSVEYRADTTLYISRLTEPDADMIADSNITSGKYFMVGNTLYKATANIASGSAVIVGTNAIRKSLSEALNEINA